MEKGYSLTLAAFVAALSEQETELSASLQGELRDISTQLEVNPRKAINDLLGFLDRPENATLKLAYETADADLADLDGTCERSKCLFPDEGTEDTPEKDDRMLDNLMLSTTSIVEVSRTVFDGDPVKMSKEVRGKVEVAYTRSPDAFSNVNSDRSRFLAWLGAASGLS